MLWFAENIAPGIGRFQKMFEGFQAIDTMSYAVGTDLFNLSAIGVSAAPLPENSHNQTMGECAIASRVLER